MKHSPFLSSIQKTMYTRRYSKRTIETYLYWIKGYILFHNKRHPSEMGSSEVERYLDYLVLERHVAAQTQAIALNALNFLYKEIIRLPICPALHFVK